VLALVLFCVFSPATFDIFDFVTSSVMMPLGALGIALFVGWNLPDKENKIFTAENRIKRWAGKVYLVALRWLVPIAIILIFLNSLGVL